MTGDLPTGTSDIDAIDSRLLILVAADGRRPAADLAKDLGLSRQAVAERLRSLERRGVIRSWGADVDPRRLGLRVQAQLRLSFDGRSETDAEYSLIELLQASPQVRSIYRVSGEDCFVVDVVCRDIPEVNELLRQIQQTRAVRASRTSFVLETLLERRPFGPLSSALFGQPA